MMKRLLSLDQSSKTTGYAIFNEDGNLEKVGKFTFETSDLDKRLVQIRSKVKDLIDEFNIEAVAYEDIQHQNNVANNVQTFKILAEVYGVISELLAEYNIPHTSIPAVTWKSTLKIKGKTRQEQKKNAQEYVLNTYGLKVTQDEADSVCIGKHYILAEIQ